MLRPRMIVADSEPQPTIHVRSAALTLSTMLRTCYPLFSQRCIFCDTVVCRYLNIFSAVTWTHGTAKWQEPGASAGVPKFSEVILQVPL